MAYNGSGLRDILISNCRTYEWRGMAVTSTPTKSWRVEVTVEGDNDNDRNNGGFVVSLRNGHTATRQEVSRVAFIRRNSKNPKTSFKKQLKAEIARAQEAADLMNALPQGGLL